MDSTNVMVKKLLCPCHGSKQIIRLLALVSVLAHTSGLLAIASGLTREIRPSGEEGSVNRRWTKLNTVWS
jgi:hypothetical protein